MRKLVLVLSFCSLILFINGCVDEIKIGIPSNADHLVVDGMITDLPGPYTITLSYSNDYFEPFSPNKDDYNIRDLVQEASVSVIDDQGNEEVFAEISPGVYQSSVDGMRGQIGTSYVLKIELENGKKYESLAEIMPQNVGIKDYAIDYTSKKYLADNLEKTKDGLNISLIPNGFDGTYEFYRWRWEGTYQVETNPELKTKNVEGQQVPDPPPCTLETIPDDVNDVRCKCCICWVTEPSNSSIVSSKTLGDSKTLLHFLENTQGRLTGKYYFYAQQLSITKEAYEFWNIIKQQEDSGSPFSITNTEVPSNIVSIEDKNEKVMGFFSAASVKDIAFFVNKSYLKTDPVPMDVFKNDCRVLKYSTNVKPSFW
ncbi:DUF4249 domain-containing protein [Fulvivirga lutimaris]|uniref:DUF4249 domain-containing protein n=1 Tax=Fulvivirga lutimaris TaxID=1819566 RepID=UPI001C8818D7|nr:DUF4249 domain-containing protein [Fulvivirga lutimaris]